MRAGLKRVRLDCIQALADYDNARYRPLNARWQETLRRERSLSARISELTHLLKGNIT